MLKRFVYGILLAFALLIVCIIIKPAGLSANDGLSYYGGFKETIVPYTLAFFVAAYTYWDVASSLPKTNKIFVRALKIMSVLVIGLLLTPHTVLDTIHATIGTILFVLELVLSFWFSAKDPEDRLTVILSFGELIAGIVAFNNLSDSTGYLLQAQVAFQILFAAVLARNIFKNQPHETPKKTKKPAKA